jgi:hypothetical protein
MLVAAREVGNVKVDDGMRRLTTYLLLSRQSGGALNSVRCQTSKIAVLIRGASQKSPR